jgi:8-oxo-dGTP pyrophosphatase MutT (NUDIX family)
LEQGTFIVNVEVAVVREGRYLAIERGSGEEFGAGWLVFPGGKVDADVDTPGILEETARREVLEEVGLIIDGPIAYVESHTFAIDVAPVLDVVMLARSDQGEPYPASADDEVADLSWLTLEEFLDDPRTQEWTRKSLELVERRRIELGW